MAEPTYVRIGGQPWKADPEQAQDILGSGGKVISAPEAQQGSQAINDLSYVDQNWGNAGKFGMGALSGLTLGMGPGALASLGMIDPGHLGAAQESGYYTAGDLAGTVAPAIATGGESLLGRGLSMTPAGLMTHAGGLAERLAGGILGDSAGLLGRMGSAPIRMAAKGGAEGALISMGHATGNALLENKPLSAEAIASAGLDGALFGGLMGGTLGTVGSIGSNALESLGSAAKNTVGKGLTGGARVARRFGMAAEDLQPGDLEAGGRADRFGKMLQEHGSDVGDSTTGQISATATARDVNTVARKEAIAAASKDASGAIESFEARLNPRLTDDIVAPRLGTGTEGKAAAEVKKFWDGFVTEKAQGRAAWNDANGFKSYAQWQEAGHGGELRGTAKRAAYDSYKQYSDTQFSDYSAGFKGAAAKESFPKTWEGVIEARDRLAASLDGKAHNPVTSALNPDGMAIRREILNSLDSEIRASMEHLPEGVADKYTGATQNLKLANEMDAYLGKMANNKLMSSGLGITGRDIGWAGVGASLGRPAQAISFLAGKGIQGRLEALSEPWMAQMAYNNSFGTKAAAATQSMQSRIGSSLKAFFQNVSKVPAKAAMVEHAKTSTAPKYDRKSYEALASKAEQLVSANHQQQVQKYAESMAQAGYTDLAQSILDVNQRAVMYTLHSMPARKATEQLTSLRKSVVSKDTSLEEKKFIRKFTGIAGGPHALMDSLESGSVSRDQVQAVANVYPEAVNYIAQTAAKEIVDMKARGDFLPMDKIMTLGMALNAPIDRALESDYIAAVQSSLAAPDPSQPKPAQPQQSGGSLGEMGMAMMTPLQTITIGQQA